jgi:formylglycine-generating enzyme required for sulfatase activity/Tfp pilus assembly major pilin PilA
MKTKNGITLIALIITIIVLLILAGVSINMVLGDNGVITKAKVASEETNKVKIDEQRQLAIAQANMNFENIEYTDSNGVIVTIPAGFAPTEIDGEDTVENGLVIIDGYGNEFVWIPVADVSSYVKKVTLKYYNLNDLNQTSLADYYGSDSLITSYNEVDDETSEVKIVTKAGGFWVGRYEVGIDNAIRVAKEGDTALDYYQSKNGWTVNTIKVQQGLEPVRDITQTKALELANNWLVNSSVQSGLITGTQWDVMCSFLGVLDETDSSSWGNYKNTKSKIYTALWHSGTSNKHYWSQITTNYSKAGDDSSIDVFPTGIFVTEDGNNTSKKNIYDIAGNLFEWTTELVSTTVNIYAKRVIRGGSAYHVSDNYIVTCRDGGNLAGGAYGNLGFRLVLYVK